MEEKKLDQSKSRFASKIVEKQNFEEKASEVNEQMQARNHKGFEISKQFMEILKNKTLPENKGPLETSLERDLLKQISEFSYEINNDLNQPHCMGSTAIDVLLLRSIFVLRDGLNEALFKINQLEKQKIIASDVK